MPTPKIFIAIGVAFIAFGTLLYGLTRLGVDPLRYVGNLPGDIRIESQNGSFYFPITTCIALSLLASGLAKLWGMFK